MVVSLLALKRPSPPGCKRAVSAREVFGWLLKEALRGEARELPETELTHPRKLDSLRPIKAASHHRSIQCQCNRANHLVFGVSASGGSVKPRYCDDGRSLAPPGRHHAVRFEEHDGQKVRPNLRLSAE